MGWEGGEPQLVTLADLEKVKQELGCVALG